MVHGRNWRESASDEARKMFDGYAHAVSTISVEHRLIHDGMLFSGVDRFTGLANAASRDYLLKVPAATYPHLREVEWSLSDGPCDVYIYEGTTVSADGTEVPVGNNNRNSTNAALLGVYHSPTITDIGTAFPGPRYIPAAGAPGNQSAGSLTSSLGEEWILKPSTNYLLRVTNNSGGAIDGSLYGIFYELSYQN